MRRALIRLLPLRALSDRPVAVGAPAALFALLALRAALAPVADPDVWWIAVAGRELLAIGHVPTANGYSFAAPAHPWVMHEWLVAAPYALGLARWGTTFVSAVGLVGAGFTGWLLARATVARSRHLAAGAGLALVAITGCRECLFAPRPGYLALALALALADLSFAPRWTPHLALAAVCLELLWTNVHGSFPLGVALLTVGALAAVRDRRGRAATAAAALAVTALNPYGLRLHGLVGRYLRGTDPAMALVQANIAEFAPLWRPRWPFASPYSLAAAACVAALMVSAFAHRRHRARASVVLGLLCLAALHVRHLALAALVGCVLLVPEADDLLDDAELPPSSPPPRRGLTAVVVLPGLLVGVLGLALSAPGRGMSGGTDASLGGAAMARLAVGLPSGARVYAPFEASGRLLWVAPPGVHVLLDPRNDCYPAAVLEAGFGLQSGRLEGGDARAVLDRYEVGWLLVPDAHGVARAVARDAGWTVVRREGDWTLRRRATHGERYGAPIIGQVEPVAGLTDPGWSLQ